MDAIGHPQGIARRPLAGAQYTLDADPAVSPAIPIPEGAQIGVRKISGASTEAAVYGRFKNDTVFTRARNLDGADISVSLGSAIPIDLDIYMFAEIKLVVSDAVVFVGGKT